MSLTGPRRPNEQKTRLGNVGILPTVTPHREHHASKLCAIYGIVGRQNKIIDRCVLIERRDVVAIQNALLAALIGAFAPLSAGESFALHDLPSGAATLFADFYHVHIV